MIIRKVFRIDTVRHNWPISAHASPVFSRAHCTDSEDLPITTSYLDIVSSNKMHAENIFDETSNGMSIFK